MIDFVLIEDPRSGIGMFRFMGKSVTLDDSHENLFEGFLQAFKAVLSELNLGMITQISTETHHCIFYKDESVRELPIFISIMFDYEDCVDHWKVKAREISSEFLKMFKDRPFHGNTADYDQFREHLIHILEVDANKCQYDRTV